MYGGAHDEARRDAVLLVLGIRVIRFERDEIYVIVLLIERIRNGSIHLRRGIKLSKRTGIEVIAVELGAFVLNVAFAVAIGVGRSEVHDVVEDPEAAVIAGRAYFFAYDLFDFDGISGLLSVCGHFVLHPVAVFVEHLRVLVVVGVAYLIFAEVDVVQLFVFEIEHRFELAVVLDVVVDAAVFRQIALGRFGCGKRGTLVHYLRAVQAALHDAAGAVGFTARVRIIGHAVDEVDVTVVLDGGAAVGIYDRRRFVPVIPRLAGREKSKRGQAQRRAEQHREQFLDSVFHLCLFSDVFRVVIL